MNTPIVVAKVKKVSSHPDAKKLKVCQVFDGTSEFQVVCGAFNVKEEMITIFAPVGAKLPSGKLIQQADLRGVQSAGMLCSAKDLSITNEDGIIDLPSETLLGQEYTLLDKTALSSIPWHQYQEVEQMWEDQSGIKVIRKLASPPQNASLIGQTFWDQDKQVYLYRFY